MSDLESAIVVKDLSKSFKLPHEHSSGLKQLLVNVMKRKKGYETQHVLKDISFEIKKGEFFGIVGRNGSGKSTLLKLLAGIYTPDNKGLVQINGSLTSFIELGVGFNPELTGRENVYLNGALLGFSRKKMAEMYDEIVEFAELERFMDQKLKNYSSGMQVRLAFSIAIRADSDILLLDEVLAVGDEAFQRKCFEYFAKLQRENKTVVLVTHDMGSVRRFCTRAMLISNGSVVESGSPQNVAKHYEQLNLPKEERSANAKKQPDQQANTILSVDLVNGEGKHVTHVFPGEKINLVVQINSSVKIQNAFLGVVIQKSSGEQVFWATSEDEDRVLGTIKPGTTRQVSVSMENIFGEGEYAVNLSLKSKDRTKDYAISDEALSFSISGWGKNGWMLHPHYTWESKK